MTQRRMSAEHRTAHLTKLAYEIAKKKGIEKLTRVAVATEAGVTDALINRYFGNREGLRTAVIEHAIAAADVKFLIAASEHYILPTMPKALAKLIKTK